MPAPSATRVRFATDWEVNQSIDEETRESLRVHANCPEMIDRRLRELDHGWDIERLLETNASALALLGLIKSRWSAWWLLLSLTVMGFLLQHAIQGWCPPVWLFRRLGVRTRREIDEERTALKILRGDFHAATGDQQPTPEQLLNMVRQPMPQE